MKSRCDADALWECFRESDSVKPALDRALDRAFGCLFVHTVGSDLRLIDLIPEEPQLCLHR